MMTPEMVNMTMNPGPARTWYCQPWPEKHQTQPPTASHPAWKQCRNVGLYDRILAFSFLLKSNEAERMKIVCCMYLLERLLECFKERFSPES